MIFLWNSWNIRHIEGHDVRIEEVQYVMGHMRPPYPQAVGNGKYAVWGQTAAGRFIQVIFAYRSDEVVDIGELSPLDRLRFQEGEEVIYVVHARDLEPQEKRQWRRRKQ